MLTLQNIHKADRCPSCGNVRVVHPVTRELRSAFADQPAWTTVSIRNRIMTILPTCKAKQISNGLDLLSRNGEIANVGYGKYERARR